MGRKVARFDPVEAEAQRNRAAAATLERLERDLRHADWRIQPHLESIRERLFQAGFTAEELLESCPGDRASVTVSFHSQIGESIWDYISKARLETGSRLLRDTDLRIGDVSNLLGYSDRMVFSDAFLRWVGLRPQEFRKRHRRVAATAGPAEEDLLSLTLLRELRRELEPRRLRRLLAFFEAVAPRLPASSPRQAAPLAEARSRPLAGESLSSALWELLATMPEEERRHWVRHVIRVDSPAFFHLLGEKLRQQVRKDPRACLELAQLALEHLEANEQTLGEQVPELRALAWAWQANARRLLEDFAGAEQGFVRAWQEWKDAGGEPRVEAEICWLEANFRLYQRRNEEALDLLARSISLAEAMGYSRVLVSSLLMRVAVIGSAGDPAATIPEIRRALGESKKLDEPSLTLVAYCDLATTYVLAGHAREALEVLPRAEALCEALDEPVTRHQLQWTKGLANWGLGDLDTAEQLLRQARSGFIELNARGYGAVVSLDLAILCFEQGRYSEVPQLAAEAIPVFETLGLRRETVAAVELLRRAIVKKTVTLPILKQARARLVESLHDPAARRHGANG